MNYFVTAIGTDSGKTLVSAILCEALEADYWKPVQAGSPRDTDTVANLICNRKSALHPEQYFLNTPASPHAAAKIDGVNIQMDSFALPKTDNTLVIEGAGGCMVPLNDEDLVIDLIATFRAEVIVVSNLYLGSINHTLLTLEALNKRGLPIKGVIFNGEANAETERIILQRSGLSCLLRIEKEPKVDSGVVSKYAALLKEEWHG